MYSYSVLTEGDSSFFFALFNKRFTSLDALVSYFSRGLFYLLLEAIVNPHADTHEFLNYQLKYPVAYGELGGGKTRVDGS